MSLPSWLVFILLIVPLLSQSLSVKNVIVIINNSIITIHHPQQKVISKASFYTNKHMQQCSSGSHDKTSPHSEFDNRQLLMSDGAFPTATPIHSFSLLDSIFQSAQSVLIMILSNGNNMYLLYLSSHWKRDKVGILKKGQQAYWNLLNFWEYSCTILPQ